MDTKDKEFIPVKAADRTFFRVLWIFVVLVLPLPVPHTVEDSMAASFYYYRDEEGNYCFTDVPSSSKFRLFAVFRDMRFRSGGTENKKLMEVVTNLCRQHNVDENLIRAIIKVESGFQPTAVSRAGAQGLMQIMPQTQRELGLLNPFDPKDNIDAGIRYLKMLMQKFGRLDLALAGYNAGPSNVEKYGGIPPFQETRDYVKRVLEIYQGRKTAYN